jgi:hypothetical protein
LNSVAAKTCAVQNSEKYHCKQDADEHPQYGKKPDLFLVRGQFPLFPANGSVWHGFSFIHQTMVRLPSGVHPMKVLPEFRARLRNALPWQAGAVKICLARASAKCFRRAGCR